MKKIKNIIFDLGGVLFPIDGKETQKAFESCGVKNFKEAYYQLIDSDLFRRFEIGEASDTEFRKGLCGMFGTYISDDDFDCCWNAMIVSYPKENNPFLEKLRDEGYNLYVLSNTNEIHVRYLEPMSEWREGLFSKIYYSNEIDRRKPDVECFEWVVSDAKIKAEETVFIDDRADNIEGAKQAGLKTIHLLRQSDLYETLDNFLK